jgi:hypothetical protein
MSYGGKVAFLFLTIQGVNKEGIWRTFFKDVDPHQYSLYHHPKYPQKVDRRSFLFPHAIDEHVETQWAHLSLVKATICLLRQAMRDPANQRFQLVSESCIPVIPFSDLRTKALALTASSFCFNPVYHLTKDCKGRYQRFKGKHLIPQKRFQKAHQWFICTREAAQLFTSERHLQLYDRVFASDEHYFINTLLHARLPVLNRMSTYADFEPESSHPSVLYQVSLRFLQYLASRDIFFLRKVDHHLMFIP